MNEQQQHATRLWTLAVPTVSAFVASLVRSVQDRDDILQETAIAVLDGFDRYDPSRPFVGWAIGIARNQVRLYFRRRGRDRLQFDLAAEEAIVSAFSVNDEKDGRLNFLEECIEHLDAKSRQLCQLRYENDLKPAAIGQRVGLEANTVAKALQRIRDRLRECIQRKFLAAEVGP